MTALTKKLAAIIVLGVAIRVVVVYTTEGTPFDIESYRQVYEGLKLAHFGVYDTLDPIRWPYPPGYMPWVVIAGELGDLKHTIRFGSILADVGIIWLVQDLVGRFGGDEQRRLIGAGLIGFGPICIGVAGFNGQVDPAATLPALFALWLWTRPGLKRRGLLTGLAIGLAGSMKTVPLVLTMPFAAAAKTRREALEVFVGAGLVVGLALLPFFLKTPGVLKDITSYQGLPGFGGIGLLVQPQISAHLLSGTNAGDPDIVMALREDLPKLVLLPALAALAAFLAWRRPDALTGICLTFLTVYVFGVNLFISYLVWSIPFFVVRGHFTAVAALQLCLAPAQITVFANPVSFTWAAVVYTGAMAIAWLVAAGVLGGWVYRLRPT
jgi:hypothetical protein